MNLDQIIESSFQIIMFSGNARSMAMEAISKARDGQIDESRQLLAEARTEINQAHRFQTKLIQAEANGEKNEISVLLIHSQDHLMNGMTVLDLAEEFICLYELVNSQK
ncbi:MAG: PTS lactose/cellobiose transporter subunit IIA [Turicibacter sp.]|nr:PTS lactose/cellobiose transporter subunit IIA [Turicibacter sp.]